MYEAWMNIYLDLPNKQRVINTKHNGIYLKKKKPRREGKRIHKVFLSPCHYKYYTLVLLHDQVTFKVISPI